MLKSWSRVARNYGCVIEEVEDPAAVSRKEDLLFSALNNGGEVNVVGFLQLLTSLRNNVQPWKP